MGFKKRSVGSAALPVTLLHGSIVRAHFDFLCLSLCAVPRSAVLGALLTHCLRLQTLNRLA